MRRSLLLTSLLVMLGVSTPAAAVNDDPYWNAKPLAYWLTALKSENPLDRIEAAHVIAEIAVAHGPASVASAVPQLVASLSDADPAALEASVEAIEHLGSTARSASPRLLALLDQPSSSLRRRAALALSRVDPGASAVVSACSGLLRDDADVAVRQAAAVVLVSGKEAARPAMPVLTVALADPDPLVRVYASAALARAGDVRSAIPVLFGGLDDGDPAVRAEAAGLIAEVIPTEGQAVPLLTQALSDPDPAVRIAAADGLGSIGRPAKPAIQVLWKLIRDPNEAVRECALRAIRLIRE
jgi:HEAT repeat protein